MVDERVWALVKENKKFIYGFVREGARAKDYEVAIMWLSDCGLVHTVNRVNAPNLPVKAYADLKAFKLFLVDVGLLGCMTGLKQNTLLDGNDMVVPVEVKAEINLKAKSLKTYREKFNPQISIRTAMTDYRKESNLINLPLYAIEEFAKIMRNRGAL